MPPLPPHGSDVDTFLDMIRSWLTDPAGRPEQRLVICAVQRGDVIHLVDGTPLDQALRRITIEGDIRAAASRPGPPGWKVAGQSRGAPAAVSDQATKSPASSA